MKMQSSIHNKNCKTDKSEILLWMIKELSDFEEEVFDLKQIYLNVGKFALISK